MAGFFFFAFFFLAGFFFLATFFLAGFLASGDSLYLPLFLTKNPDLTPEASAAFKKRFLLGSSFRNFLIAARDEPARSLRPAMAVLACSR